MNDEVTVAEAAQLLNVSEHYVDEQLATGGLPFRMVGSQRVLRRADVMAYRARMHEQAEAALAALTAEAEDLGLYGSSFSRRLDHAYAVTVHPHTRRHRRPAATLGARHRRTRSRPAGPRPEPGSSRPEHAPPRQTARRARDAVLTMRRTRGSLADPSAFQIGLEELAQRPAPGRA